MLRSILFLFWSLVSLNGLAQTPVLRPKPITINLADPKGSLSNLTKEEKARYKQLEKEQKSIKKEKKRYFKQKLDSLALANYDLDQAKELASDVPETQQALKFWDQKDPYVELVSKGRNIYSKKDSIEKQYSVVIDSIDAPTPLFLETLSLDSTLILNTYDSAYLLGQIDSTTYFHLLDSTYTVNDSINQRLDKSKDHLDSTSYKNHANEVIQDLESRTESHLEKGSGLSSSSQSEDEVFSSYEEMIESDKYKSLMESMPGKRDEIEADFIDMAKSLQEYPELENVFKGYEKELNSAIAVHQIIKEKPTMKDVLSEFFDQDMDQIKKDKLIDRFSVSGMLQVTSYDPVLIDFSPSVAFAMTSKVALGIGGSGRVRFGGEDSQNLADDVLAYRGFMDYDVFKGFYFHGEYERTGAKQENQTTEIESRFWSDRFLIGIGKDLKMKGIFDGSVMLLYSLDSEIETSPNPRRIQVRYGIKIP